MKNIKLGHARHSAFIDIGKYFHNFFQEKDLSKATGFEFPLLRIGQFESSVHILRGPCPSLLNQSYMFG